MLNLYSYLTIRLLLLILKTKNSMKKLHLLSANPINKDLGLLLIRLIIGLLMAFIGYQKLIHFNEMAADDFWAKNVSFLGMKGATPLALTVFAEFFCSSNHTYINSCGLYFWCFLFSISWKHGYENRNKNKRSYHTSGAY